MNKAGNKRIIPGAVCYSEYPKGYLDFLELADSLDLSWVEFKYETPLKNHRNSRNFREIRRKADYYDIGLSLHTAFSGLNIASINKDFRRFSLENVRESIAAAGEMEIEFATLHVGFLPSADYTPENWKISRELNIESIENLVEYAWGLGVTLCLENSSGFNRASLKHGGHPGYMKYIRENVGERLKYTVDFGHGLFFSENPSYLVTELGLDNVKLSHLHSNNGLGDTHSNLGTGILALDILLERYIQEGWDFPLSIEMKKESDLRISAEILREKITGLKSA